VQPRAFTVGAGRSLETPLVAPYDVEVHGPNGFYRHLKAAGPHPIGVSTSAAGGELEVQVRADGADVRLTITDHHGRRVERRELDRHERLEFTIGHHGWYDVTIASADGRFVHRLAGHVETGRPSISDPALGR